jgi:hypothetical protein
MRSMVLTVVSGRTMLTRLLMGMRLIILPSWYTHFVCMSNGYKEIGRRIGKDVEGARREGIRCRRHSRLRSRGSSRQAPTFVDRASPQ